jgi:hypothetical protein
MFKGIATATLAAYARPPENPPERLEHELQRLVQCTPKTEQDVYNGVLCAVGNNQAGSYYPIVVPMIPLLGEVLKDGTTAARETTLNILIDLVSSFGPEPGFETIETSEGPRQVEDMVWQEVTHLALLAQKISKTKDASQRQRQLTQELTEFLEA